MGKELDRKEKIEALKIKNNRKLIIKNLEELLDGFEFQGFIEKKKVKQLFFQAYSYIYENEKNKVLRPILLGEHNEFNIKENILENQLLDVCEPQMILFYQDKEELDAIYLSSKVFLNNINSILKFVGFSDGEFDLMFIKEDLTVGLCIESDEYNDRLFNWNRSDSEN